MECFGNSDRKLGDLILINCGCDLKGELEVEFLEASKLKRRPLPATNSHYDYTTDFWYNI
jgi:hypothetical protein